MIIRICTRLFLDWAALVLSNVWVITAMVDSCMSATLEPKVINLCLALIWHSRSSSLPMHIIAPLLSNPLMWRLVRRSFLTQTSCCIHWTRSCNSRGGLSRGAACLPCLSTLYYWYYLWHYKLPSFCHSESNTIPPLQPSIRAHKHHKSSSTCNPAPSRLPLSPRFIDTLCTNHDVDSPINPSTWAYLSNC